MSHVPQYSPQAALSLALLKSAENDVDIFVEDSTHPAAWTALVRRGLKVSVTVRSVHAVGNKQAVIAACRADQAPRARRRLFIVDGDLDVLTGETMPKLRHLYRLQKSCFENLLLHENSYLDLGVACSVTKTEQDVANACNFVQWHAEILSKLRTLFFVFATMHSLGSQRQQASVGFRPFITQVGRDVVLDSKKIRTGITDRIKGLLADFGARRARRTFARVRRRGSGVNGDEYISGKHFLFPLFAIHFRTKVPFRGSNNELMVHLARAFHSSIDPGLYRRLRRL